MKNFNYLIEYFREYDLYNNMLSNEIKDKWAKDIVLKDCDFHFINTQMTLRKKEKIFYCLQKKLNKLDRSAAKQQILHYVNNEISLEALIDALPFTQKLYEVKRNVDEIKRCNSFHVYYPIFYNKRKRTQQSLITFSCELLDEHLRIVKLYTNKDILTLLIASQNDLELADTKTLYAQQLDEFSTAVDALRESHNFVELYDLVGHQFEQIFKTKIGNFVSTGDWQLLNKAKVSFEPADDVIDNCFRDELETLIKQYERDEYLPETVQRFLGVSERQAVNIADVKFCENHSGSYQSEYIINQKQWQIMQVAKHSSLLCVEGPPGTGKTTLLKEMIADELVLKADDLLKVWDEDWTCLGDNLKGIYRSPLEEKNRHSIVISSTNNKAIDNIGLELLKEIEYFTDFTDTIEYNERPYKGMLCARLGKGDNIKDFYENFYAGFIKHLDETDISPDDADYVREEYQCIREDYKQLTGKISHLLIHRNRFPQYASYNDILRAGQELQQSIVLLTNDKSRLESRLQDRSRQRSSMVSQITETKTRIEDTHNLLRKKDEQIHNLYADLQQFERSGGLKRRLSFLFPQTKALLKKYESIRQINDEIQIIRDVITENQRIIETLESKIIQTKEDLTTVDSEISSLESELRKLHEKLVGQSAQEDAIIAYNNYLSQLSKENVFANLDLIGADTYNLCNLPILKELRHKLFTTALRVFEAYIMLHKVPILHNLSLTLKRNDGPNGDFYSWCWMAQNLHRISDKDKQALVRDLWETFFLCFPVVTTTLHSFRKKTFAFIPELFDILMVDESGQIVPYYVVAPMYRANRAIFVGDVHQIEPIKSVPVGLLEKKYLPMLGDQVYNRFCIDTASAQSYAINSSDYIEIIDGQIGGVILNEHRRCEPSIMAFSNQHIYHNVLSLIGKDNHDKLFGRNLVAFDVRGFKAKEHYNQAEIDACKQIVDQLVLHYGETVRNKIGVITPFSSQAKRLKQAIRGVETGTVHVFQGDEKEYILFSCVLDNTAEAAGLYNFVGGKGNLLNVAFSRAKKQLIYVGNFQAARDSGNYLKLSLNMITEKGTLYSLFDTDLLGNNDSLPDKGIVQILAGKQNVGTDDEIGDYLRKQIPEGIIAEPKLHNVILNDMLSMSKECFYIISPWIGGNVVTDTMLKAIKEKVESGIQVRITFGHKAVKCSLDNIDDLVAHDIPWRKEDSAAVIRTLRELLGEALQYAPPSHVKLLLVDNRYLFIGSLNWLFNSGKTKQKEISCLITNPSTITYVKDHFLMN